MLTLPTAVPWYFRLLSVRPNTIILRIPSHSLRNQIRLTALWPYINSYIQGIDAAFHRSDLLYVTIHKTSKNRLVKEQQQQNQSKS